jgi:hypothetical protein
VAGQARLQEKSPAVSRRTDIEDGHRSILFNLCGHGHFDMQAYIDCFDGKLGDEEHDASELAMALAGLPSVG